MRSTRHPSMRLPGEVRRLLAAHGASLHKQWHTAPALDVDGVSRVLANCLQHRGVLLAVASRDAIDYLLSSGLATGAARIPAPRGARADRRGLETVVMPLSAPLGTWQDAIRESALATAWFLALWKDDRDMDPDDPEGTAPVDPRRVIEHADTVLVWCASAPAMFVGTPDVAPKVPVPSLAPLSPELDHDRPRIWQRRSVMLPAAAVALIIAGGVGTWLGVARAHSSTPTANQQTGKQGQGTIGQPRPRPRTGGAIAFNPHDGSVVLFGGTSRDTILGDTWVLNGHRWRQLHPAHVPPPRFQALLVYDDQTQRAVLLGGYAHASASAATTTWLWDGSDWTQGASFLASDSPAGRAAVTVTPIAAAYDVGHGQLVVVARPSGFGATVACETWLGTDRAWIRTALATPPCGLATYDAASHQVVLISPGDAESATYIWTGNGWEDTGHPLPAGIDPTRATVGFDAARGQVVVYSNAGDAPATYLYDGRAWSVVLTAPELEVVDGSAQAVSSPGGVVIVGGDTRPNNYDDLWSWEGKWVRQ